MWMIFVAAIVPGILLLYYVYNKDFNPEPKRLVYKGFLYGCASVFVSTLISGPLMRLGFFPAEPGSISEAIKVSFFGAAIPEESAKLFMLWLLLRNCPEFDERYNGMVYAASVGLGFACLENLMYVLSSGAGWFQVSVSRAIFAVPGHFAFAIVMGYYYSRYHFRAKNSIADGYNRGDNSRIDSEGAVDGLDRLKIWLYPVMLHGIYDSLVFSMNLAPAASGIITLALIWFCYKLFKSTRQRILDEAAANRRDNNLYYDPRRDDGSIDEQ